VAGPAAGALRALRAPRSAGEEGAAAAERAVVLRLRTELRAPGCLHTVLECVAPRPPYVLENRSGHPLRYRQARQPPWGPPMLMT
jgi:hypothetical protein